MLVDEVVEVVVVHLECVDDEVEVASTVVVENDVLLQHAEVDDEVLELVDIVNLDEMVLNESL